MNKSNISNIISISRFDKNLGDLYSNPTLYFNFKLPIIYIDIFDKNKIKNIKENQIVIIGGGGLLNRNNIWDKIFHEIGVSDNYSICWGIGVNSVNYKNDGIPLYLNNFDKVGLRDYNKKEHEYVPCSSCMLDLFDKKYKVNNKYIIFEHMSHKIRIPNIQIINNSIKKNMNKRDSLKFVFNKLGSSEIIITNSYHGLYWGTLLNKKVIFYNKNNISSKFKNFKYTPTIFSGNLMKDSLKCNNYPNSLKECRDLNNRFYKNLNIPYE
jgi:hypothetical protein